MTVVDHDQVALPGGTFRMGDSLNEGYPVDGEEPAHAAQVGPLAIDVHPVTNRQFARFVDDTGYRTEAERFGSSTVFHLLVRADDGEVLGRAGAAPWWLEIRGADWRHPVGPRSDLAQLAELGLLERPADHPVVHVSWNDAMAYCRWVGRRLPTEAEWEWAARGGLDGARFPWGDRLLGPGGEHRCNIWQGDFPSVDTGDDGFVGTSPVGSYPANGYGLVDTVGNVWEWCTDWFSPHTYRDRIGADGRIGAPATGEVVADPTGPATGTAKVIRGGSYLCHHSYCYRYRVAARGNNTPGSSTGNTGFRTVALS